VARRHARNSESSGATLEEGFGKAGPIRVRSILTIKTSVCSAKRNLTSEFATVAAEGTVKRLCTPANMPPPIRDRSKVARKPPRIVASVPNPARPEARFDALSTKRDRAWQEQGRERRTRRRLDIRSDLAILRRGRAGPGVSSFRGCRLSNFCPSVPVPEANGLDPSAVSARAIGKESPQPWMRTESPVRSMK
jgi:hypothetical protein